MSAPLATVIILVILLGAYLATRPLPGPNPGAGPCARDSDCPHPQTCVGGACTDTELPALLGAAQHAARVLYGDLQDISAAYAARYYQDAAALGDAAVAMGLSPPPPAAFAALRGALAQGAAGLGRYMGALAAPGCDPARSAACGYCAEIAALTPGSAPGAIFTAAAVAPSAAGEVIVATGALPPASGALANIAAGVLADAQAKGKTFDGNTAAWYAAVTADAAQIRGGVVALTQQAAALRQTGYALYSHLA